MCVVLALDTNATEADVLIRRGRPVLQPGRVAEKPHVSVPCSSAHHPEPAFCRPSWIGFRALTVVVGAIPVPAPLPNISEHVVQSPGIRPLGSHNMSPALRVGPVPSDFIEIADVPIADTGSRSIFPFSLRRKPVQVRAASAIQGRNELASRIPS